MGGMQNLLRLLYPDQCISCGELVDGMAGLCGACWRDTPFNAGHTCITCDAPLMGEGDGVADACDDCMADPPPWRKGAAVLTYGGAARRIILNLKHGDRMDLVPPVAEWMAARARARGLVQPETVLVPVPLYWTRLVKRRFNQAAQLARAMARTLGTEACPDALIRTRATRAQERMTREERMKNLAGAIRPNPRRTDALAGRSVLIVDDVMTSGATLGAAARAAREAGAKDVCVAILARVVKGG